MNDATTALSTHVKDIPKVLEGGLNGYRDVCDNSPWYAQTMLKVGITSVELGLTSWIKDPVLNVNVNSGFALDTIPLNPA